MPIWLMVLGGLFLVGLVVSFVVVEWRSSHGTLTDRRGGHIDPLEERRRREGGPGSGADAAGGVNF
jgi:hypothetical protein